MAKFIIFAIALMIFRTDAVPQYHRVKGHFGEDVTAFEDVMIDEEAGLLIATVAKITSKRVTPSIAFHDFNEGFSVIKLVERGVCYVERGRHTLEELRDVLLQAEKDDGNYDIRQSFKCLTKTFIKQEEVSMYGERIAAFCKDYESVFVEKEYKVRSKRSLIALGEGSMGCFICGGDCNHIPRHISI